MGARSRREGAAQPFLMAALLDTSVVVRYLTGDPPRLAAEASRIIDGEEPLALTGVVIAESAYVLSTVYGVSRADLVDALIALIQRRNMATFEIDKSAVIQALLLTRPSKRVSFADAMVWAAARSAERPVYSFDDRFPGDGIELLRRRD
jgi:predicted nucleic acid-binding protein